eukprot:826713-Alexandrium_andersonii.AAC.1
MGHDRPMPQSICFLASRMPLIANPVWLSPSGSNWSAACRARRQGRMVEACTEGPSAAPAVD